FSINGDRIGYGGGYYDRYMEAYPNCQYLAVCYDYQVLEEIPYEQHDRRPNVILTEQRIFYIS
ncbi:MAG: 5-formyltetrahydrofolate cyclo-ligase, partial [Lachnospiraceae bacterium]|nr:5-formyltetrahydrofolate cyclo-ligase [Lachnospiraceae bacterium]